VAPHLTELMEPASYVGRSNESEIDVVYRRQAERCGRLAFLLVRDDELAQDLVQEAFVRLMRKWRTIRNPIAVEAYLQRIVVNLARKSWRRRTTERRYLEGPRSHDVEVEQPDVETRDQLRIALSELPFRQRAAIVLRYYEDLSEAEIARLLGCPKGTVKSSLSRGLVSMRVRLEGEDDE
jgi:RNA polymerase sigma-70 factor (sigma-E family)